MPINNPPPRTEHRARDGRRAVDPKAVQMGGAYAGIPPHADPQGRKARRRILSAIALAMLCTSIDMANEMGNNDSKLRACPIGQ